MSIFKLTQKGSLCTLRRACVSLFCVSLLSAIAPVGAATDSPSKDTVLKLVDAFVKWNGQASDRAKLNEAAKYLDFQTMSERALGPDQWAKITVKQKSDFIAALKNAIEKRYYPRWHRLFAKGAIAYGAQSVTGNKDVTLDTTLTVNKSKQNLSWLLDSVGGEMKVVSLRVDKNDLLTKLHERISLRIKKSGFDNVLAWLKSKSAEVDKD